MARKFIADITPYFHARPIVYVDGGAHTGRTLRAFVDSGLPLREAHLIEPNPASFAELQAVAAELADRIPRIRLHNVALSAAPGRVRMSDAGTMSRVLAPVAGGEGGAGASPEEAGPEEAGFVAESVTLDSLAWDFVDGHVSILKLDVEGSEPAALQGARELLSRQAIDVIYLEAGLSEGSVQQSHYRVLEDLLAGYGYKVFGIYEQTHEWPTDSPLLRRMNLGFMSERFAASNPHRLSRELYHLREDKARLEAETKALQARLEAGAAETQALRARLEASEAAAQAAAARAGTEAVRAETEALRARAAEAEVEGARAAGAAAAEAAAQAAANAAAARSEREALSRENSRLLDYGRWLENRYAGVLASTSWRALEPARWVSRRVKGRDAPAAFVPRLDAGPGQGSAGGPAGGRSGGAAAEAGEDGFETAAGSAGRGGAPAKDPARAALVRKLEDKLWGGFSSEALPELEALAAGKAAAKPERAEAWFALARWRACLPDPQGALDALEALKALDKRKGKMMRVLLLESASLRQLGRVKEARKTAADALAERPDDPDLLLVLANCEQPLDGAATAETDARRLGWVNRIYDKAGLAPLRLADPAAAFAIDNLAAEAPAATIPEGGAEPRVSIIMPVYGAAATLPFALRGLLAQSWRNLEILVVDDCSPDNTVAVAEAAAAADPRVRVIRQTKNQGSYAARNAGLRAATGDYVTTHDADDWSHPQKIELQVRHLMERPEAVAVTSAWIRCEADMTFRGLFRPWAKLISKNVSSLMFPRAVMERLGGWVEVRIGADTEMMRRTEAIFGPKALERIAFQGPLSFSLHEERSLTRQSATHVRTVYYGVRKELQDAAEHWRRGAPLAALTLDPLKDPRPFPAPSVVLPERPAAVDCDLLFVSDFAMDGGAFESTFNYVRAAAAAGRATAAFHWRRHDLDVSKAVNSRLRDLAQEGGVRIVAPGERVRAGATIVGYPVILRRRPDLLPEFETERLVLVVNQMASRLRGGADPQYDPRELAAELRRSFGTEGIWAPISGLVRQLMREDPRYPEPARTIWTPLIDVSTWCATPPRWRGGDGAMPVIGRHARDHYTKWPSGRAALAAAYLADRPARVEIMGGASQALAVLGEQPQNWRVTRFGAQDARSFLAGLDAFVHYPHEDYIEEFGRAVLEAMAAGLPAVLPPVFEQTFGPAALYAEPDQVWERISALWADGDAWIAQGKAGQDFARTSSDWSRFPDRLAATLAEAEAREAGLQTGADPDPAGGPAADLSPALAQGRG